jgi:hypothetical protein
MQANLKYDATHLRKHAQFHSYLLVNPQLLFECFNWPLITQN